MFNTLKAQALGAAMQAILKAFISNGEKNRDAIFSEAERQLKEQDIPFLKEEYEKEVDEGALALLKQCYDSVLDMLRTLSE